MAIATKGFPCGGIEVGAGEAAVDVMDVLGLFGPALLALEAGGEEGLAKGGVFLGEHGTLGGHGAEAGALHGLGPTRQEGGRGMVASTGRHRWRQWG